MIRLVMKQNDELGIFYSAFHTLQNTKFTHFFYLLILLAKTTLHLLYWCEIDWFEC